MGDSFTIVSYDSKRRRIFANRTEAEDWVRAEWDITGMYLLGNKIVDYLTDQPNPHTVARVAPARFGEVFPLCRRKHGQLV